MVPEFHFVLTQIFMLSIFAFSEDFSIVMDTAVLGTLKNIRVKQNLIIGKFMLSGFYCMYVAAQMNHGKL